MIWTPSPPAHLWAPVSHVPELGSDALHVWRAKWSECRAPLESQSWMLAPDELARAERFYRPEDRFRFVLGRVMVRTLLGAYLGTRPDRLQLDRSEMGKPMVRAGDNVADVRFNLSHAGDWVFVAAARSREVGVDVEQWNDERRWDEIATRFFAPAEIATLQRLPQPHRTRAFFDCWTRKEAYVKATGNALSTPLDRFEVSLAPDEPAALLWVGGDPEEQARWTLEDLAPGHGYSAAVAVEGLGCSVRLWEWAAALLMATPRG